MQIKTVLTTPLYVSITLGKGVIYFIVTGIQFWMMKYLIEILDIEPLIVNIIFLAISVTAPYQELSLEGQFLINMEDIKEKM